MKRRLTSYVLVSFVILANGLFYETLGAERPNLVGLIEAGPQARQEKSSNQTRRPANRKKKPAPFKWVNALPAKASKALQHQTFESDLAEQSVGYAILLPPNYETTAKRYPVVYYLHGGRPGSETKGIGIVPQIERVWEDKSVDPAIYVFVNGGPVSHYNVPGRPEAIGADIFIKELIPHIDETYRTIADRSGRALEGFSQGGRGTMRLSLRYPELFISAAAGGGGYETERQISLNDGKENETLVFAKGDNVWDLARRYDESKPRVNWLIFVGDKGFNYENNLAYMDFLKGRKIHHQSLVVPGVAHSAVEIYRRNAAEMIRFHARNFRSKHTPKLEGAPKEKD